MKPVPLSLSRSGFWWRLLAQVANRVQAPGSKLAALGSVNRYAHIDCLAKTSDDACYRAMDRLLDIAR